MLKIASDSPIAPAQEDAAWPLPEKAVLDAALNQPYVFLNSGGQSYAFLSEDGKTIIKFFKQHHIRTWRRLNALPLPQFLQPYRKSLLEKKKHQSPLFLESCRIADRDFKERTGLIYLHLNKTDFLKKKLKIIDKLGIVHFIDLDTTDFALQKRVELSHFTFKKLIEENDLETAKRCIDSLLELIVERCQKGIDDCDPNVRRNIGFLNTQAIEMDLGSFTKIHPMKDEDIPDQLVKSTLKIHRWLSQKSEILSAYMTEKLEDFRERSAEKR